MAVGCHQGGTLIQFRPTSYRSTGEKGIEHRRIMQSGIAFRNKLKCNDSSCPECVEVWGVVVVADGIRGRKWGLGMGEVEEETVVANVRSINYTPASLLGCQPARLPGCLSAPTHMNVPHPQIYVFLSFRLCCCPSK